MQFSFTISHIFSAVFLTTLACSSHADVPTVLQSINVESDVLACKSVKANDKRLACYDRLFAQTEAGANMTHLNPELESRLVEAPKAALAPVDRPNNKADLSVQAEQAARDNFGAEKLSRKQEENDELSELAAIVTSVTEDARRRRTFFLANGQVWEEAENSRVRAEEGTQVVISKGFFSAYYLKRQGTNTSVRVNRIK